MSTMTATEQATPALRIETLTDPDSRLDALRLVADGVAQQSPAAATRLTWHPLCLSVLALGLAATVAFFNRQAEEQHAAGIMVACCGVVMAYLAAIRYLTSGYVQLAETTDWLSWLRDAETMGEEEDLILGVRYGDDIIGATVMRLVADEATARKEGHLGRRAVIRAWVVKLKYRGKGLGSDMLREAVALVERFQGDGADVCFDEDHAYSKILLPKLLVGTSTRMHQKTAERLLAKMVEERGRGEGSN